MSMYESADPTEAQDVLEPEREGLGYQFIMFCLIVACVIAPRLARFVPAMLALAGVVVAFAVRY